MMDAAHSEAVACLAGSDESEALGEGIVLEPAKGFLGVVHLVTSNGGAKMLMWQGFHSFVEGGADVAKEAVAVLDLHWVCVRVGRDLH